MVVFHPIKASALHHQYCTTKIVRTNAVILNRVNGRIQTWNGYMAAFRLDATHAQDRGDHVVGQIALTAQAPTLGDQIVDALIAAQRGLNLMLTRGIGARTPWRRAEPALRCSFSRLLSHPIKSSNRRDSRKHDGVSTNMVMKRPR